MNIFNKILLSLLFILALHTNMHAGDNPFAVKTSSDRALFVSNKKHELLQMHTSAPSFRFSSFLKEKNTKQSTIANILNWDIKIKFRLTHNLNIIFSYN